MPWLKLLHISAVIVWCGVLLYLPSALIASVRDHATADAKARRMPRLIFLGLATPAALVAISSGTAIFALQGPLAMWLIAKLVVVGLLVLGHGVCGMLILRNERLKAGQPVGSVVLWSRLVAATSLLWLGVIAWLVLAKPFR